MSSTFVPAATTPVAPLDPHKHVNYTLGMILGVDDFRQEFAYLSGHEQWLTRDLLGYGTVSGLQVSTDIDEKDPQKSPRVLVEPGVAISPRGELIRIASRQCAPLNTWLATQNDWLNNNLDATKTNPLTVYVVLSYRECESDTVPMPGEDNATVPSRLADDFLLDLRFDAPQKREEEALGAFVAWLRRVRIADENSTPADQFTSLPDFEKAIRTAAALPDSALNPPSEFMSDDSNVDPSTLIIPSDKSCEYWQSAFSIWDIELRSSWRAKSSSGDVLDETRVLLAELDMYVTLSASGDWVVDTSGKEERKEKKGRKGRRVKKHEASNIIVDEETRPYLLQLRLLQEWMLCGRREVPPSDTVVAEKELGRRAHHGKATAYSRGDHTHGTPTLTGDVSTSDNRDGTTTVKVQGLLNIPIAGDPPEDGQVLMYDADKNQWWAVDLEDVGGEEEEEKEKALQKRLATNLRKRLEGVLQERLATTLRQPLEAALQRPVAITMQENYVEHPGDAGRYLIVAAGLVRCDGTSLYETYNHLVANTEPTGQGGIVRVHFRGYTQPGHRSFPYVVKVLPRWHERLKSLVVYFDHFEEKGFVLRVTDRAGNPIRHEQLREVELMIEVSHYGLTFDQIQDVDTQTLVPTQVTDESQTKKRR